MLLYTFLILPLYICKIMDHRSCCILSVMCLNYMPLALLFLFAGMHKAEYFSCSVPNRKSTQRGVAWQFSVSYQH